MFGDTPLPCLVGLMVNRLSLLPHKKMVKRTAITIFTMQEALGLQKQAYIRPLQLIFTKVPKSASAKTQDTVSERLRKILPHYIRNARIISG